MRSPLLGEPLPVELMNTLEVDRSGTRDTLSDGAAVAAWRRALSEELPHLSDDVLRPASLREASARQIAPRLRDLRDALRRLAAEVTNDPRPVVSSAIQVRQDAIDVLNASASSWPELRWPTGGEPSKEFRAADSSAQVVSLIAREAVELFASARRDQLRACLAPRCLRYFLKEHPRREWCSDVCGNRVRVARHYHGSRPAGRRTDQGANRKR